MKKFAALLILAVVPRLAFAQTVTCPFIADLESGDFSNSKKNYKCFSSAAAAKKAGFVRAPTISSKRAWSGTGNFNTEIFALTKGSSISHSCTSSGYFGVKIRKASDGRLLDLPVNIVAPTSGKTRTYDSGAVFIEISTTSKCTWVVEVG